MAHWSACCGVLWSKERSFHCQLLFYSSFLKSISLTVENSCAVIAMTLEQCWRQKMMPHPPCQSTKKTLSNFIADPQKRPPSPPSSTMWSSSLGCPDGKPHHETWAHWQEGRKSFPWHDPLFPYYRQKWRTKTLKDYDYGSSLLLTISIGRRIRLGNNRRVKIVWIEWLSYIVIVLGNTCEWRRRLFCACAASKNLHKKGKEGSFTPNQDKMAENPDLNRIWALGGRDEMYWHWREGTRAAKIASPQ